MKMMQLRLKDLGYFVGPLDSVFGPATRSALLTFQAENGLATDAVYGDRTRAALESPYAKPNPEGSRVEDTLDDLRKKGSKTITNGDHGKGFSIITVLTGIGGVVASFFQWIGGAFSSLPEATKTVNDTSTLLRSTDGFLSIVSDNVLALALIALGIAGFFIIRGMQNRRLDDHKSGANKGR